jgi:hypothetical protein
MVRGSRALKVDERTKEEKCQMATTTKTDLASRAQKLIAGTTKHLAGTSQLGFASNQYTPAQVTTSLQTIVDLRGAVNTAKAATKAKVAQERAQAPALRSFMSAFESYVKVTFGNSPDVLADFGLQPKKAATPLSVEDKAAAVAKRESTRKARQTMGSQQRKEVKGDVKGVVVTAVHDGATTAPSATGPSAPATSPGATGPSVQAISAAGTAGATPPHS